jgi:hypothetical protein
LIGEIILKKDTSFRKAISVQERLVLTLHFLAVVSCRIPEVCEALVEKLMDGYQKRLTPTAFEPQTIQPITSCYTNCAVSAVIVV